MFVQPVDPLPELVEAAIIFDDVCGRVQALLPIGLGGEHPLGLLARHVVTGHQAFDLDRCRHIDNHHAVGVGK